MNEILTCEGLSKRYGKGQTALDGVELHLEPGASWVCWGRTAAARPP